jgi:hypothetical protein
MGSNAAESSAYQVSGGLLHLNTVQIGGSASAYYQLANAYDHTLLNTEIVTRMRVLPTTNYGVTMGFYDATKSVFFTIGNGTWQIDSYAASISSGTFANPSDFHVFDLRASATTDTYTFLIDGNVVATGSMFSGGGTTPIVYFGDATPTGGNAIADIAYVNYINTDQPLVSAVPEPTSLSLGVIGIATLAGYGWRRRRVVNAGK